jgi:hypothetical protein
MNKRNARRVRRYGAFSLQVLQDKSREIRRDPVASSAEQKVKCVKIRLWLNACV